MYKVTEGGPNLMYTTEINGTEIKNLIYPSRTFFNTTLHVHNITGNVAEMVKYKTGEFGSRGGSWNSTAQEIEIYAPDTTKGNLEASPMLGFRIVLELN